MRHRAPGRPWHARFRAHHALAGLLAGAVALGGTAGTYAWWSDQAQVTGTTVAAGTLDLRLDGADSVASTTLGLTDMVPGDTSAQVVTVANAGTVPLTYAPSGSVATAGFAGHVSVTVTTGARSGSGKAATCGGTTVFGPTALSTTTAQLAGTARPLQPAASESLCVQLTFSATAPSSLQGATSAVALGLTGAQVTP